LAETPLGNLFSFVCCIQYNPLTYSDIVHKNSTEQLTAKLTYILHTNTVRNNTRERVVALQMTCVGR